MQYAYRDRKAKKRDFNINKIGLYADKEIIHNRINQRVDQMILDGWLNEINENIKNSNLNALNTVGYKELFRFKNNTEINKNILLKINALVVNMMHNLTKTLYSLCV